MRLISLNAWCGRSLHPLMRFFRKWAKSTDVFCLQEVLDSTQEYVDDAHPDEYVVGSLFEKIQRELTGFWSDFAFFDDNRHRMSQAMFVREGAVTAARALRFGDRTVFVPKIAVEKGSAPCTARKLQFAKIEKDGRMVFIINCHGLWDGPKTDTPDRIAQSKTIRRFLDEQAWPTVLVGDFNLLPDTESLRILTQGMRELVTEYGIASTRTPLYRHYDNPAEPNFADYAIVSPEIVVDDFRVLPDIASDHCPLLLDFHLE